MSTKGLRAPLRVSLLENFRGRQKSGFYVCYHNGQYIVLGAVILRISCIEYFYLTSKREGATAVQPGVSRVRSKPDGH